MSKKIKQYQESEEQRNLFQENLAEGDWLGEVVDNQDPLHLGRCRVKVFELFDDLNTPDIPWASPCQTTIFSGDGGGSFSYPKLKHLVRIRFNQGSVYSPEYHVIENLNSKMISEIKDDYVNAQVLLYDEEEDLKIIYTQGKGLLIWKKKSLINIKANQNILINHAGDVSSVEFADGVINIKAKDKIYGNSPLIHLDSPDTRLGPDGHAPATRCPELMELLGQMAAIIDSKGPSPSSAAGLVSSYVGKICSTTVTVAK